MNLQNLENIQLTNPTALWNNCARAIQKQISQAAWQTWLDSITCELISPTTMVLALPSVIVKKKIEQHYITMIQATIESEIGIHPEIILTVKSPQHDSTDDPGATQASTYGATAYSANNHSSDGADTIILDARYTFDSFIIGSSNRFAHAAALSVAEAPAHSYNPLLIHGGTGLGKTHLLHAIGNYIALTRSDHIIRYVSTEKFLNDFVEAIRNNTTLSFKKYYRECDILLVDDIQFLEGKEQLQEEFFHTFSDLYGASKQLVFTSDKPPKSLSTLEHRLKSRFMSGLITDVQPPELETRLAILHHKSLTDNIIVPQEVYEYIATNITTNIRELEGALTRVTAYSRLTNIPLTLQIAQTVLADTFLSHTNIITPEKIISTVAKQYGYTTDDLKSQQRARPLVHARQMAMYLFRELTDYSYPAIARHFGDRDHTTVIHAVEKITKLIGTNRPIYDETTLLTKLIKEN
ncbi:MAG: chromosomal replication initiator protein DnaA [Actinobacteria bacterium]|jgi:chromosomal replication initiator protein|nr:chromosomal replication initiator protein DnaA [Actinomycetota bacterium]